MPCGLTYPRRWFGGRDKPPVDCREVYEPDTGRLVEMELSLDDEPWDSVAERGPRDEERYEEPDEVVEEVEKYLL